MRLFAVIFSGLILSTVALSAAPASTTVPATAAAPLPFTLAGAEAMASGCIVEHCLIVYPEMYCTCEWVTCNGRVYCGILHETEGLSQARSAASCGAGAPAPIAPGFTPAG